ncbi:hypothetical protein [Acrocarpospora catenulata]|uniref:hypothetical protein n=1 Tax=Acrocarpospora catenulata TaxID=2836182 RepID=UPI0027E0BF45|nr:hypothetical protein [Acrocarpospora catenulata]
MRERRSWPTLLVASALTVSCAIVAGIGASAALAELTRGPSQQELRQAGAAEIARRWQVWPAGRIFPATIDYIGEQGGAEKAHRVGISTRTECGAAMDAALRDTMRKAGCQGILRATYLDALEGIVVTIGVAAFPDPGSADTAAAAIPGKPAPGLRALAFPRTVTDRFTAAGRQASTVRRAGPYLVMTTAGQVDGRPARALGRQRPTMFTFTADLADRVARELLTPVVPDCASEEFQC